MKTKATGYNQNMFVALKEVSDIHRNFSYNTPKHCDDNVTLAKHPGYETKTLSKYLMILFITPYISTVLLLLV